MKKIPVRIYLIIISLITILNNPISGVKAQDNDTPSVAQAVPKLNPQQMDNEPAPQSLPPNKTPSISKKFTDKNKLITVITSVDKAKIQIGDKVSYRIEITTAPNVKVTFPEFGEFLGGFAITDYNQQGPIKVKDAQRWIREYTLDVYVSEKYIIPPVRLTYQLANGEPQQIFTQPLFVTVESVLTDNDTVIHDIKPVALPPVSLRAKIIIGSIIGGLILICIITGLLIWIRRRKHIAPPPLPAHIIALQALEQLKERNLIEQGRIKEYYFLVSNILRHYIERRFGLMAPERTTEEFFDEMQKTSLLPYSHKDLLHSFLRHCDMVKFAKYDPSENEIESIYKTAVDFIQETKVPDEPEEVDYEEDED